MIQLEVAVTFGFFTEVDVPRVAVGPDADGRRAAQRDGERRTSANKVQQGVGARAGQRCRRVERTRRRR